MYINGIQCDVCCKVYSMNIHHDPLPEGWFSSAKGDELEKKHFCSLECFISWASQQLVDSTEYVSDEFGGLIKVTSNGEK